MASTPNNQKINTFSFPSPSEGPFQRTTLARVMKLEESLKDSLQLLTEIQLSQLRMEREQHKQGKIIRNIQRFVMDNQTNPIIIEDDSSNVQVHNPLEEEEEEDEEVEEEMDIEDTNDVICVGEVYFDKDGNVIEQNGEFCLHYPHCPIHKSPIVKNT